LLQRRSPARLHDGNGGISEHHTAAAAAAAADARLSPSPVRHLTNRSGFRIRILHSPSPFTLFIIYLLAFPLFPS